MQLIGSDGDEDEMSRAPAPPPAPKASSESDCSHLDGSKFRIDAPADFHTAKHTVQLSAGMPTGPNVMRYDANVDGQIVPIFSSTQAPPQGTVGGPKANRLGVGNASRVPQPPLSVSPYRSEVDYSPSANQTPIHSVITGHRCHKELHKWQHARQTANRYRSNWWRAT